MSAKKIKHVTVIGVGLLGGSAALAIKAHDPSVRVAGVGRRKVSLDAAIEVGAIDTAHFDPVECVGKSDLVILATPVGAFEEHLRSLVPALGASTLVTDVGSTKVGVARLAGRILGPSGRFVGSHPMAGSEQKGVRFSRADLFSGATCIITPTASTPDDVTDAIEAFWESLGMRVVRRSPAAHDRAVARISHLPHVLAGLMMLLPGKNDLDVSASGFRDVTRLASGDPEMWRDILLTNRGAVLAALDRFSKDASVLRDLIDRGDAASIEKFLARAKRRRDTTIARVIVDRRLSAE
jgi:prephenate dehydrogenase